MSNSKRDNRIVVSLDKVQYARLRYRNQYGETRDLLPKKPTLHAMEFDPDEMHINGYETLIVWATRNRKLDIWTPEVKLQVQANHSLTYTGPKAISLWDAWCKRQFKKK